MRSLVLWLFCQLAYYGQTANERDFTRSSSRLLGPRCAFHCYCYCYCCSCGYCGRSGCYREAVRAAFFLPHPASTQFFCGRNPRWSRCLHLGIAQSSARTMARRNGANQDPAHSSFLSRSCRPARSFLGRSSFLPSPLAGVSSTDSAAK